MPLPPFPTGKLELASPTPAPFTPLPPTRAPAAAHGAANGDGAANGEGGGTDDKAAAEKIGRMKKLLAAADKRLAQAHATIQERDARIQRLLDGGATPS